MDTRSPEVALLAAVEVLGSQVAMAKVCGLTQPSVHKWVRLGKALPAEHVLAVEAATGISRHELRPDIYPREDGPRAAAGGPVPPPRAGGSPDPVDDGTHGDQA
jgi:DNA-binding transcriptional regulator YdaS (Cro superfamily)